MKPTSAAVLIAVALFGMAGQPALADPSDDLSAGEAYQKDLKAIGIPAPSPEEASLLAVKLCREARESGSEIWAAYKFYIPNPVTPDQAKWAVEYARKNFCPALP